VQNHPAEIRLLRRAQQRHPGDLPEQTPGDDKGRARPMKSKSVG
jgi:hypothetical protein